MSPRKRVSSGRRTNAIVLVALAGLGGLTLSACGGGGGGGSARDTHAGKPATVTITGFKFMPERISVAVGTTVTWTNADAAEHTATSDRLGALDTGTLMHGQSKSITFTHRATIAYHCDFHPFMHGTITAR